MRGVLLSHKSMWSAWRQKCLFPDTVTQLVQMIHRTCSVSCLLIIVWRWNTYLPCAPHQNQMEILHYIRSWCTGLVLSKGFSSSPTILRLQPRELGQKMISSWRIKHDKVCSDDIPIDYFSTAVTLTWNCRVNRNTNKRLTTFSSIKALLVFMFAHRWACMKRWLISDSKLANSSWKVS